MELNRRWLSHFSREIAEMIDFRNAERLFAREISRDLTGHRQDIRGPGHDDFRHGSNLALNPENPGRN